VLYFIQDTVTSAIKVGWSKDPKKRLTSLQTATANQLVLLGAVQGGLEHEAAMHAKFAEHRLHGEWFRDVILREVLEIIAKEAANPPRPHTNVIVAGDSDPDFIYSSDEQQNANRAKLEALVRQSLNDIHAKTPIAWVLTGGERQLEHFAWRWAKEHRVELYRQQPNWKKYGRFAGFKVAPQLLRTQFHPKLLLVFLNGKASSATQALIRSANKAKIEVVTKSLLEAPVTP